MQTIKGRIIEIQGDSVIILTCRGEFIQKPLPPGDVQIGKELSITTTANLTPKISSVASAAAAAAMVCFLLFQSINVSAAPAYYVHLDADPGTASIELALSKSMRVVEATAFNDEGEKILSEASLNKKTIGSAIKYLVNPSNDSEHIPLNEKSTVLISIAGVNNNDTEVKKRKICKEVQTVAKNQLRSAKTSVTFGIATVDANIRKQALTQKGSINTLLKNSPSNKVGKVPKEYEVSQVNPTPNKNINNLHNSKDDHRNNPKYNTINNEKNNSQLAKFNNNVQQHLTPMSKNKEESLKARSKENTQSRKKIQSYKPNQSSKGNPTNNSQGKPAGNNLMKKIQKHQNAKENSKVQHTRKMRKINK